MRVTVVTNAFQQAKYLEAAVESVLSQDWPDLEYLVVDPGSSDGTDLVIADLQRRYPQRFELLTDSDDGPADGLNKAFRRATGDLFVYLNGDDLFLPGAISEAVAAAGRYPKAAAIYGDGFLIDGSGQVMRRAVSTGFSAWRFVYGGAFVLQQSTFYRAEAFREVGGFNALNRTSWDAEILFDMSLAGMPLRKVPGFWSIFRIHGESITGSQRLAQESRRNHDRLFSRVTGRSRTAADRGLASLVRWGSRLLEPRATMIRVADAIRPPTLG